MFPNNHVYSPPSVGLEAEASSFFSSSFWLFSSSPARPSACQPLSMPSRAACRKPGQEADPENTLGAQDLKYQGLWGFKALIFRVWAPREKQRDQIGRARGPLGWKRGSFIEKDMPPCQGAQISEIYDGEKDAEVFPSWKIHGYSLRPS